MADEAAVIQSLDVLMLLAIKLDFLEKAAAISFLFLRSVAAFFRFQLLEQFNKALMLGTRRIRFC